MNILETPIKDLYIIEPKIFGDNRGYFFESFNQKVFEDKRLNYKFVQDNESSSGYGVVRGLHYQLAPHAQTKLVRVVFGKVYDVAVDIRKESPTFGKWYGIELSDENKRQFLIPRGFAHGFAVLSENAVFQYKCDAYYEPASERGIIYNDPILNIDWKIAEKDIHLSKKDSELPEFLKCENNFI
ncbi:MAG TPA: dTDP-4-dehydrorhamnose 3,5-epimerase [Prolixibacteraceae bacterium]|nr:dTDP-4-dehydrorhamnose 3,5-epimerase [Bacteroidales bacterium]HPB05770.1 dTDP-4-dehydrorhamnose 3,5-epimerase [Prolixibacteraceae bacterium]HQN94408.1 dTDP-4-dehydrorhamnose 3,5-epimerase [Prolixibacteraceae bacterium]HUM88817.1 dTDP-4-dehydrorhamnose 3,5-epimerase [Prolixibacteraceae bacterium]